MREQIIKSVLDEKIVVIVRGVEKEKLLPLAEAMYKGGIRLLELTYSANGSVSDEETASRIKLLSDNFKGRMYIGAGTVLTPKQVELTKNAGGEFIISPDANKEVIEKTRELSMVSMPGALTPTEIQSAHRWGADFVKVFPAAVGFDSGYIKAVKAPLSHIRLLAVGGVGQKNMEEFFKAGACGIGVGSEIINKKMIDEGDFDGITKLASDYIDKIKDIFQK